MSIHLRRARDSDLAALLALETASFASDRLSVRQYRRHLASPRASVLVATAGGGADAALAGAALVLFRRGSALARLYSLAVVPAFRGRGVGQALLGAAEAAARARGCAHIGLEVRQDNAAAVALYAAAGYERIGQRQGYYADGMAAWRCRKVL